MSDNKKILIVTAGLFKNTGGPSVVISSLIQTLSEIGFEVHVYSPCGEIHNSITKLVETGEINFHFYSSIGKYKFNHRCISQLYDLIFKTDLVWVHGLFQWPVTLSLLLSNLLNKKTILTPHGVLTSGMLNQKKYKKVLLGWPDFLLIKKSKNIIVHFLSLVERESTALKIKNKFILPNIVDVKFRDNVYNKKICFIGRLAKIKGIDDLLKVDNNNIDLYGHDQDKYTEKISSSKHLNYYGELTHDQVPDILSKYEAMILPSYGEGLPTSLIEAALAGKILIISTETNLDYFYDMKNCIKFIPGVKGLDNALTRYNKLSYEERVILCSESVKTAKKYYSKQNVKIKLIKTLNAILH